MLTIAYMTFFILISLCSTLFIIRQYRSATTEQRRSIILGCVGAVAVAVSLFFMMSRV